MQVVLASIIYRRPRAGSPGLRLSLASPRRNHMVLRTARPRSAPSPGTGAASQAASSPHIETCDRHSLRGGAAPSTNAPSAAPLFQLAAAKLLGKAESSSAIEYLQCVKVKPDGRCLFRSLVLGLAANKGRVLSAEQEESEADLLRAACGEAICPSLERRSQHPQAVVAITSEMTIQQYCDRVVQPNFWGGESELLVLTSLLKQPVTVYVPAAGGRALGYSPIVSYGTQFSTSKSGKERKFVKLLYSNGCVRCALLCHTTTILCRGDVIHRLTSCGASHAVTTTTCSCE